MRAKPKARIGAKTLAIEWLEQRDVPASFFVSPTGNDSNTGASIANPFQTIQFAIDSADDGDTINILPGTFNSGKID
ncbi:MAG: DUF1565 domain-containing protein [Planctomycetota bacterium]